MELFSPEFFSALLAIVVIDLVLAGDNAIVIAMAARNLPTHLQKKAIVWGAVGAIAVRSAMTLAVVYLLKIPGLMLVGGLLLVWIAVLVCVIFTFVYGWNAKDDRNKQDTANRYQSFATLFIWIQLWLMLVLATQWTPLTWNLFPSVARNAEQVTLLESLADTTSYTY